MPSSQTAAVSSESCVHDRRLRLSEPTEAQTSSMMQTFAWTYTGCPAYVLEPVERHPVAARRPQAAHGPLAPDGVRRPGSGGRCGPGSAE